MRLNEVGTWETFLGGNLGGKILMTGAMSILVLGLSGVGNASNDSTAERMNPCRDGWLSCADSGPGVVVREPGGLPEVRGARVSWMSLEPRNRISPFVSLSKYEGPESTADTFEFLRAMLGPVNDVYSPPVGTETILPPEVVEITQPETLVDKTEIVARLTTPVAHTATEAVNGCSTMATLEPKAMMGRLSTGDVSCLESRISKSRRITEQDRLSRVLMAHAFASGNGKHGDYLLRHLEEIDRSDPDLAYKYAYDLHKKGVVRSRGVVRWSEVALERKARWPESVYSRRVYTTLKIRAIAAQRLWEQAESQYVASNSDKANTNRKKYRNLTKTFSREWLEYAKAAKRDHHTALTLCFSAAGTSDYCE